MMATLAMILSVLVAVFAPTACYLLAKSYNRMKFLQEYIKDLEAKLKANAHELRESQFRESILTAKLDMVDSILGKLNQLVDQKSAETVRKHVQPYLLSNGVRNGTR